MNFYLDKEVWKDGILWRPEAFCERGVWQLHNERTFIAHTCKFCKGVNGLLFTREFIGVERKVMQHFARSTGTLEVTTQKR